MLERLIESLQACPLVKRGDDGCFIHPITDGVPRVDPVAIVDDVISTGGTLKALIHALEHAGADVADICVAIRRERAEVGRPVKSLVDIEVVGGKVGIVGRSL